MKQITWLFFDIGGVLADESAYQNFRSTVCLEVAGRYISDLSIFDYQRAYQAASSGVGSITDHIVRFLLEKAGRNDVIEEALQILATQFRSGPSYLEMETIRPEAAKVIERLAQKYCIGIIANQPEGVVDKLRSAGIMQYLHDCTLAGDAVGKPNPEYYLQVMKKTGAKPEQSIMIDDNLVRGILPAKALDMTTIWFGQSRVVEGVDYTVTTLNDLLPLLLS
jgi:HAD superfamily hydrolase (TIGR01509 family)